MEVYKNIARVQGELAIAGISKDRSNSAQGYKFRGIDDVYNALAPVLSKHGLCILPRILSRELIERTTKTGTALFYVTVEAEFDFVATEDGSKHTVRTYGEAMDSGDKATNKAMSAAYKYAAFQAFCIPTEGDNDADSTTHEVAAKKAKGDKATNKEADSIPQKAKNPPAPNTDVADTKAAEYHERIRRSLRQLFGEDKDAALAHVETESAYIDMATGEVKSPGVKDYRKLSEGRLKVLCHKLEAQVKKHTPPTTE